LITGIITEKEIIHLNSYPKNGGKNKWNLSII
jgi:hypothetical protein